jgi:glycosyltransferase involved in cell wall biosynthesis
MKIFFHVHFDNPVSHSFHDLSLGNPGIGGTEYATISLATELSKRSRVQVFLFSNVDLNLLSSVILIKSANLHEAAFNPVVDGNFLVFRPKMNIDTEMIEVYKYSRAKLVAWTHVTPSPPHLRILASHNSVSAVVALGNRQFFSWIDNPVSTKTFIIQNGQYPAQFKGLKNDEIFVTYLGALVPQKGFHVLAKAWSEVSKSNKNVSLLVIGSGNLYREAEILGTNGLADPIYEEKIFELLGESISSVKFLGKTSAEEKAEIISRTTLGVVNPTGNTENCPASVLDFQAAGVPVISARKNGLIDTVIHGETGILIKKQRHLAGQIEKLLKDQELQNKLGSRAVEFVEENFKFDLIVEQWLRMFESLTRGNKSTHPRFSKCISVGEILATLNSYPSLYLDGIFKWPTLVETKMLLKSLVQRFR